MMFRNRHPSFERLHAFAVKELSPSRRDRVADHLRGCSACRNDVTMARLVIGYVRESFAPEVPTGALDRILARRAAGERTILATGDDDTSAWPARRGTRRRAALVIGLSVVVAGTAAALSSPPVRELWNQWWPSEPSSTTRESPEPVPVTVPTEPAPAVAGVTVPVAAGEVWVAVDDPDPSLRIHVRLTEGRDVEVRSVGPGTTAVFKPRSNGVGVVNAGPGELHVEVPRGAARFVLRVDGVPFIAKNGSELRVLVARVDTAGSDLVLTPRLHRPVPLDAPPRQR